MEEAIRKKELKGGPEYEGTPSIYYCRKPFFLPLEEIMAK
jgi:hypothetical protein